MENLLKNLCESAASAMAKISGGAGFESIDGMVKFFQFDDGCVVVAQITGLPKTDTNIFGFHIHEKGICDGDFSSSGDHFGSDTHPNHAGDLPLLFSADGKAFCAVLTNRFKTSDIIGRAVVIHDSPDDFVSQPAGNSGSRIACGIISKI